MANRSPQAFIFMRVGSHAGESFEQILKRKQLELEQVGKIFWGYGGTTLHPIRHVQPFAKLWVEREGKIQILMQPIVSRADPDILPANEFSVDGIKWEPLPSGINVTGSRYAIVLDEIKPGQLDLDLGDFEVGIGPSRGRNAAQYMRGRVDKGCLVASNSESTSDIEREATISIGFQAHLVDPYAVMLRRASQQNIAKGRDLT